MDAIEKRALERARFDAWVKASGSYSWNGFNRMEDMWDAWQAALTPLEGSDQSLLELAAAFETCIPFLPSAGQRNIGKAVAQLRHVAIGSVLLPVDTAQGLVHQAENALAFIAARPDHVSHAHMMAGHTAASNEVVEDIEQLTIDNAARPEVRP